MLYTFYKPSATPSTNNNMQPVSSARGNRHTLTVVELSEIKKQTLLTRRMPSLSNVVSNMHRTTAEKGRKHMCARIVFVLFLCLPSRPKNNIFL